MQITTTDTQTPDSLIHVHAADCADLSRGIYPRMRLYTGEAASRAEVAVDSYADQIDEGSTTIERAMGDHRWFPCVNDLPDFAEQS